jgi:hypothetical protein
MKTKRIEIVQAGLFAAGIILICFGIFRGEAAIVLQRAILVCLECMGFG